MISREEARATRGGSSSSSKCQDCGNQAKKDCQHLRCRTCCKDRGFQCQTHVKSTWVPVPLKHIQPQMSAAAHLRHGLPHGPNPKRHRQIPALGLQEENFPSEVSFPAVFRCLRVTSMDNVVDQHAYRTSVSIGGHIFTGILYDQGPEPESSSAGLLHQPDIATGTSATATGTSQIRGLNPITSQFFHYPKS